MESSLSRDLIFNYIIRGDLENVVKCIDSGVDINQKDDSWDETPVALAAKHERLEVLRFLISKGANVDTPNSFGKTLMLDSASRGQSEVVNILLDAGANINERDYDGRTPLMLASINGHSNSIKALLDNNAINVDIKDTFYEQTALSWAAGAGQAEAVRLLAEAKSNLDSLDEDGRTPLIHASINSHSDTIRTLIEFKPSLDIRDTIFGQSAVSYAAEGAHTEIVELLIEAGCDVYSQAEERFPPIERAVQRREPELLRKFLETKSDSASILENPPRVRAVAEALYYAYEKGYMETVEIILAEKRYLTSTDQDGRTVLSWAAEIGNEESVKALLENGTEPDACDNNRRTPLSWAAEHGSEEIVELLLYHGAEPDSSDINSRTPLSWAAESGSLAVVRKLLSQVRTLGPPTKKEQREVDYRAIDSQTKDNNWTPLWYAALGGHEKVTKALLEDGANPLVEDKEKRNLMKYLDIVETPPASDVLSINLIGLNNIRKILEPFFSLLTRGFPGSDGVDSLFSAMVLHFTKSPDEDLRPKHVQVGKLLSSQLGTPPGRDICLKWLHLPANNMRWAEIIIKRHYESCGDKSNQNRDQVLKPKLWTDNQNIPQDKARYHERFMRAGCHVLPLLKSKESESLARFTGKSEQGTIDLPPAPAKERDEQKQRKDDRGGERANSSNKKGKVKGSSPFETEPDGELDPCHRGFVLFMPYLHWENEKEVDKHKDVLEEIGSNTRDQKTSREIGAEKANTVLSGAEKLLWMYLGEDHPLHIRRTLDQYYYPSSKDIKGRDKDQTTLRHFKNQNLDPKNFDPALTMVDQLWIWVLPKCGGSPPTIITAFPQRSNRKESKQLTALMTNIIGKCGDLPNRSCYDVAEVIVAECSRIYLDSTSNRNQTIQFLDVYRTSIGRIMDSDATRFHTFQDTIGRLNKILNLASGTPKAEQDWDIKPMKNEEVLQELLDIKEDIEDLRQVKDIRDELNMMDSLYRVQLGVIQAMNQIIQGEKGRNRSKSIFHDRLNYLPSSLHSPDAVVKRNLEEVEILDRFARRAGEAIEQLLELKQKQADLLLTKAIYNINDATDKQGKTLLTFTVVTIIFLPLSFMASFLALNIAQFPWDGDKLSLNWVVKIILSVSLPLSAALLVVAFNLNESQREEHVKRITKWKSRVKLAAKGSAGYVEASVMSAGLRKRGHKLQMDAENGFSQTSTPQNRVKDNIGNS